MRLFDSRPGTQYPAESPNRTTPLGPNGKVRGAGARHRRRARRRRRRRAQRHRRRPDRRRATSRCTPAAPCPTRRTSTSPPGQTSPSTSRPPSAPTTGSSSSTRAGSTHLIVDIAGWYGPTGTAARRTDLLTPLAARRAPSTPAPAAAGLRRDVGPGGRTTPVAAGRQTLAVQVAGLGGVPADATAVVMNVTAIAPTSGTFVAAYPGGQPVPDASNLNAEAGQTVANLVVIPVGTDGVVRFYNRPATPTSSSTSSAGSSPASAPATSPSTRRPATSTRAPAPGSPRAPSGAERHPQARRSARYDGVPADAAAVMLSVVAVTPDHRRLAHRVPRDRGLPAHRRTSTSPPGATIANAVVARLGSRRHASPSTTPRGSTHVISDLAGYFIDPANVPLRRLP